MHENVKKNGYQKFDHSGTLKGKIILNTGLSTALIGTRGMS